eukprot:scaffold119496_cov36-Phaeocystis_antarctica.AAC.2
MPSSRSRPALVRTVGSAGPKAASAVPPLVEVPPLAASAAPSALVPPPPLPLPLAAAASSPSSS